MLIQALAPSVLVDRSNSQILEFSVVSLSASLEWIHLHLKCLVMLRKHLLSVAVVMRRVHLRSLAVVRSNCLRSWGRLLSVRLRRIDKVGHPVHHLRHPVRISRLLISLLFLFIDVVVVGFPDLQVHSQHSPIWLIEVGHDRVQEIVCLGRLLLLLFLRAGPA